MTAAARHEIAKISSAIRSLEQQLRFNPDSAFNQAALEDAKIQLQAAKVA